MEIKSKMMIKIAIDLIMTVILILLMTYELIGQSIHGWIGIAMFVFFIIHHFMNGKWILNIFKGRYTVVRVFQTALVICILVTMLGSMISGIILSQTIFPFLQVRIGSLLMRNIHMVCAYSGYILMSMHMVSIS